MKDTQATRGTILSQLDLNEKLLGELANKLETLAVRLEPVSTKTPPDATRNEEIRENIDVPLAQAVSILNDRLEIQVRKLTEITSRISI